MIKGKKTSQLDVDVFKRVINPSRWASVGICGVREALRHRAGGKREGISKDPGNLFHNYTLGFSLTRPIKDTDVAIDFAFNRPLMT
jgi:hypothetical protein